MDIRTAINLIEDAQTSNFDRWFSGSKIVDDAGRPLTLYHGTSKDQDFKAFKMPKNGVWFTTDRGSASSYAEDNDSMDLKYDGRNFTKVHTASRVIPVYVRAVNPVYWEEWPDQIRNAPVSGYKRAQGQLFDMLRMKGHDAIVFGTGDHRVIVAIGSPTQIKSAIGNRGAFDSAKKNIDEDAPLAADAAEPLPLRFREEQTGYSHGQYDRRILALRGKEPVGYIDFSVWHDEVSIKMIKVPNQTRQGIARAMLKHLQSLHPDTEIEWGMLTDDGSKLYDKIDFDTVIDPTLEWKFNRLAALRKKDEELQAEATATWDKQVSPESRELLAALTDEWNAIHDEIYNLERELQGVSPSKKLIRTK